MEKVFIVRHTLENCPKNEILSEWHKKSKTNFSFGLLFFICELTKGLERVGIRKLFKVADKQRTPAVCYTGVIASKNAFAFASGASPFIRTKKWL